MMLEDCGNSRRGGPNLARTSVRVVVPFCIHAASFGAIRVLCSAVAHEYKTKAITTKIARRITNPREAICWKPIYGSRATCIPVSHAQNSIIHIAESLRVSAILNPCVTTFECGGDELICRTNGALPKVRRLRFIADLLD